MAQQAVRHTVDRIVVDGAAEHVTVVVLGGVHVFRFSRAGELLARSSDLDQLAGRLEEVAAHFADGDPARERALMNAALRVGRLSGGRGLKERELATGNHELMRAQRTL